MVPSQGWGFVHLAELTSLAHSLDTHLLPTPGPGSPLLARSGCLLANLGPSWLLGWTLAGGTLASAACCACILDVAVNMPGGQTYPGPLCWDRSSAC